MNGFFEVISEIKQSSCFYRLSKVIEWYKLPRSNCFCCWVWFKLCIYIRYICNGDWLVRRQIGDVHFLGPSFHALFLWVSSHPKHWVQKFGGLDVHHGIGEKFKAICWLVVWLPFFIFPYIGNNHPNWRSYFSEGWPNHQPVWDPDPNNSTVYILPSGV